MDTFKILLDLIYKLGFPTFFCLWFIWREERQYKDKMKRRLEKRQEMKQLKKYNKKEKEEN